MVICLKIPYYFYTNLNFQKAYISLNIDLGPFKSLSFSDFADQTEQLWKNCNVDEMLGVLPPELVSLAELLCGTTSSRSTPSKPHSLLLPSLSNKEKKWPTKLISVKSVDHSPKNFLLFLYKFKFSEAYISLNIDLGPIKVPSFLHFADHT